MKFCTLKFRMKFFLAIFTRNIIINIGNFFMAIPNTPIKIIVNFTSFQNFNKILEIHLHSV